MLNKKLSLSILCCFIIQISVLAIDVPMNIVPQAGTMNAHDLQNIEQRRIEYQVEKDYKNFEKNKKEKQQEQEKIKNKNIEVEKATAEEYATKGVYISKIIVSPSEILTSEEIKNITDDYIKTNIPLEKLKEIPERINKLYFEKGFVTAKAYIPEQTIDNETVKIELLEGKVGEVKISNNKWTRSSYIDKRINLEQGDLLNLQLLEDEIVLFNRYNDTVNLNVNLEPGKNELGTTDITLNAVEKSPFHLMAMVDNSGRTSTGEWRSGLMLQDDSLLGFRDRLTIGAFANKYSVTPFADYNIPVNKKDGRIGFNYSSGFSKIGHGPFKDFKIKSRSHNYSIYFTQPIYRKPWVELSSTTSIAYKKSITSFDKRDLFKDEVTTAQTGLNFRYDTKRGIWYANQNVSYSFPIFDSKSNYLKLDGSILRIHDFGHGIVGTVRGNYQVIPNKRNVPYLDQMIAGGATTVRGYSEGLLIGRSGYIVSTELMFPIAPRTIKGRKDKEKRIPFIGSFLKGFIFADHAGIFPYKAGESYNKNDFLTSVGCGLRINLPKDVSVKLAWGFPVMHNKHEEKNKWGRFHFELNLMPDFDALVRLRKPKAKEKTEQL